MGPLTFALGLLEVREGAHRVVAVGRGATKDARQSARLILHVGVLDTVHVFVKVRLLLPCQGGLALSVPFFLKDPIELYSLLPLLLPGFGHGWQVAAATICVWLLGSVVISTCLLQLGVLLRDGSVEAQIIVEVVLLSRADAAASTHP